MLFMYNDDIAAFTSTLFAGDIGMVLSQNGLILFDVGLSFVTVLSMRVLTSPVNR